jgi:hypothetical protein
MTLPKMHWMWSAAYKGLEVIWGERVVLSLVYTPREWKERGW